MLEHYSYASIAAKPTALEKLESGLLGGPESTSQPRAEESELRPRVTIHVTTTLSNSSLCLNLLELNGGRGRTRTCDLLRVKQAL